MHGIVILFRLKMIARQGRFVEYSVFGKETSVDWTIISDAKGNFILHALCSQHLNYVVVFFNLRAVDPGWSLQSIYLSYCYIYD